MSPDDRARALRSLARASGVLGVLLVVLAVRVVTASAGELHQADSLRARGEIEPAIAHYRRAARWYAPGNPYCAEALDRLAEIALEAEEANDPERALAAWRSIRGAILGARSFYVPHADRLALADEHIATRMADLPPPAIDSERSVAERRAQHLALLRRVTRPSVPWAITALLGLATWILAALGLLLRAIDEDDRLVPRAARLWGTIWIVGFGLFVLGLALA